MSTLNGVYNSNTWVGGLSHNSYISSRGASGWLISTPMDVANFFWNLHHGELLEDSSLNIMKSMTKGDPSVVPGTCLGYLGSLYGAGSHIMKFTLPGTSDTIYAYGHGGNGLGVVTSFYVPDLELCFILANNDFNALGESIFLYTNMLCKLIASLSANPCLLGVEDGFNTNFTVYPNPGQDRFTIDFSQMESASMVEVFDMFGKLVWTEHVEGGNMEVTLSDAPKGTYFVKVYADDRVYHSKWIKQ